MRSYNFFDEFRLTIQGNGGIRDYLDLTYRYFRENSGENKSEGDLTVVTEDFETEPDKILGGPSKNYTSTAESKFAFSYDGGTWQIEEDWSKVRCTPTAHNAWTRAVIEGEIRKEFAESGFSIVHASGVRRNGETIIFPAWRHTGKTNTMLTMLSNGGEYLSDDRMWVGNDGTIRPFPIPIHLLSYNYNSFPSLSDGVSDVLLSMASTKIGEKVYDNTGTMYKGLDLFNRAFLTRSKWIWPAQLFENVAIADTTTVDKVVLLQSSGSADVEFERISDGYLQTMLESINYYEWNSKLREIYTAYDTLIGDDESMRSELDDLEAKEHDIFGGFTANADCFVLKLPQQETWTDETKASILSYLD